VWQKPELNAHFYTIYTEQYRECIRCLPSLGLSVYSILLFRSSPLNTVHIFTQRPGTNLCHLYDKSSFQHKRHEASKNHNWSKIFAVYRNPKSLMNPEFCHLVPTPKLCEYTTEVFQADGFLEVKLTIIISVCDSLSSKCFSLIVISSPFSHNSWDFPTSFN
jgi:hypothetical protein